MFLEPLHISWPQTLPRVSEHIIVLECGNSHIKMYTPTKRHSIDWKRNYLEFNRKIGEELEKVGGTRPPIIVWSSVNSSLTSELRDNFASIETVEANDLMREVKSRLKAEQIEGIGLDRLLNAWGAKHIVQQLVEFPSAAILSIDAGTATTMQVLNTQGVLLGGTICLGVSSHLQALHNIAPALPFLSPDTLNNSLSNLFSPATNTEQAIINGTIAPLISFIRTTVKRLQSNDGNVAVVVSGGHMDVLIDALYLSGGDGDVPLVASRDTNAVGLYQSYQEFGGK